MTRLPSARPPPPAIIHRVPNYLLSLSLHAQVASLTVQVKMEAKIESLIAYAGKSTSRTITTFHEIIIIIVIIVIIIIDFTTQKHKYEGIGKIQLHDAEG